MSTTTEDVIALAEYRQANDRAEHAWAKSARAQEKAQRANDLARRATDDLEAAKTRLLTMPTTTKEN